MPNENAHSHMVVYASGCDVSASMYATLQICYSRTVARYSTTHVQRVPFIVL
jgi:hypothetical protein